MANIFKKGLDIMMWRQITPAPNVMAAGMGMAADLRNDISRNPFIFQLASATVLNRYNIITKSWNFIVSPAISALGAGSGAVFAPSFSILGSIGVGSTRTSIVTTTSITAVGVNTLANRGGSGEYGFKIRIIGNSAGGSGVIEERWITGNTGGTTPTILLDSALSFTPANGDTYEILSGKVYMLGSGVLAAGSWRSFETASHTLASLSNTNLPATIATEFSAVALDEQYVPFDMKPGEGFLKGASVYDSSTKGCLLATNSATQMITGQASAGDAEVLQNEYRNFQIRIVEDTTIPTAVNQRRIIASHTAGASPIYTLGSNWTVTPSINAKYVIEYPNQIILFSSATAITYTYNYTTLTINNGITSMNTNTWNTSYFAARGATMGAGCSTICSFGIRPDAAKNSRHSHIFSFRGGNNTTLDMLDIAGAASGAWTTSIVYDGVGTANINTGTCGKYGPADQEGRFGYLNIYVATVSTGAGLNQIYRFDVKNRVLTPFTPTDFPQLGTAASGDRLAVLAVIDDNDRYSLVVLVSHLSNIAQELLVLA